MLSRYKKRILVSFYGTCPLACRHCFTQSLTLIKNAGKSHAVQDDIQSIVNDLEGEVFDIVYVSHNRENFCDEQAGLSLVRALWERLEKDVFVITRMALSEAALTELRELDDEMRSADHGLFLATSVLGADSYGVAERVGVCPTPKERVDMLVRADSIGLRSLLMLRPVFPNSIVPIEECLGLVEAVAGGVRAVVSSGLVLTDEVERELSIDFSNCKMLVGGDTSYLDSLAPEMVRYVDVSDELGRIEGRCSELGIPFFRHTLPAINYIAQAESDSVPRV